MSASDRHEKARDLRRMLDQVTGERNAMITTNADLVAQVQRLTGELESLAQKSMAERAELLGLIEQVEWVSNPHEESVCAWCGGEEPGDMPRRDWYEEYEEYNDAIRSWQKLGHKPDCPRQQALKGKEEQ